MVHNLLVHPSSFPHGLRAGSLSPRKLSKRDSCEGALGWAKKKPNPEGLGFFLVRLLLDEGNDLVLFCAWNVTSVLDADGGGDYASC